MGLTDFSVPKIITAQVMHRRHRPVDNRFQYKTFVLAARLDDYAAFPGVANETWAPLAFYRKDHGDRTGGDLGAWANHILAERGAVCPPSQIVLVTMPRIFGYVFNPVSFWLCHDGAGDLIAVLCEVNNTFGETHTYLCAHSDLRPIRPDDVFAAEKVFHVSPLLRRTGSYRFRFHFDEEKMGIWIDYDDQPAQRMLSTAMTGVVQIADKKRVAGLLWSYPLMTLKVIVLIYWQALGLLLRGVRYVRKPRQIMTKMSSTQDAE